MNKNRSTKFLNRIEIERRVLGLVNEQIPDAKSLAGLTRRAIDNWANQLENRQLLFDTKKIKRILIEISTKADLMTDNSKEVFEKSTRSSLITVDAYIKALSDEIENNHRKVAPLVSEVPNRA